LFEELEIIIGAVEVMKQVLDLVGFMNKLFKTKEISDLFPHLLVVFFFEGFVGGSLDSMK
jgi:hypothetical protein